VARQCRNRCAAAAPPPPATTRPEAIPASFSALLPRPGQAASWINFSATHRAQDGWELVGCQTARPVRSCRAMRRVRLSPADGAQLQSLWAAARRGDFLCRIRISTADWLPFEIVWRGGSLKALMTPRRIIAQHPRCFPQAHLAWWLLERFGTP